MMVEFSTLNSKQTREDISTAISPQFTVFNQYYGPDRTYTYSACPFPFQEFPPESPWEDCVIIAHAGVELIARRNGYASVNKYLLAMIRLAGQGIIQ